MSIMNALGPLLIQASSVYGGVEEGRQKAATEKREREERERKALIEQALLDLRRDNAQLDREKFDYERTKPEDVNWQLGEDASGYFERNPRTGAIRRPEGLTPKPPTPSASERPYNPATDPVIQREEERRNRGWVGDPGSGVPMASAEARTRILVGLPRAEQALQEIEGFLTDEQGNIRGVPESTRLDRVLPGRYFQSDEVQSYMAAAERLATVILRVESGAAVPESEAKQYMRMFMPQPDDKPETVRDKLEVLRSTVQRFRELSGIQTPTGSQGRPQRIPEHEGNPY